MTGSPGATHRKGCTLALRIQFSGRVALELSGISQDRVPSLIPQLRGVLSSLRLPHPKSANVVKPYDARGIIDMYWDVEVDKHQPLLTHVIDRCNKLETSTLAEKAIDILMVFKLPENMREIPSSKQPIVVRPYPFGVAGVSSPHTASIELEAGLRVIFESIGLSIPNPGNDLDAYISALSKYVQTLRSMVDSEAAARMKAEAALVEERARHGRILQDIQMECREPFIVPALFDAFLSVSHIVENVSSSQAS